MRIQVNKYAREEIAGIDDFLRIESPHIQPTTKIEKHGVAKACICQQCGTELFGFWYTYYSRIYVREKILGNPRENPTITLADLKQQAKELKEKIEAVNDAAGNEEDASFLCPVCGNRNEYQATQSVFRGAFSKEQLINEAISEAYRQTARSKEAYEEADRFVAQCDVPVIGKTGISGRIKNDPEMLKQYLFSLVQLETNVISIPKRLKELYQERNRTEIFIKQADYKPICEAKQKLEAAQSRFVHAVQVHENHLQEIKKLKANKPAPVEIPEPEMPVEPEYQKPGFFNKKKVLAQNEALKAHYTQAMQEYERKCQKRLLDIERQNKDNRENYRLKIQRAEKAAEEAKRKMESLRVMPERYTPITTVEVCPAKARYKLIADEIEKAHELLRNTYQARNELYAANVIFEKYRDLVAVSTFYEYLMSGRCTTLEGAYGAYNLYESEIRANLIISKLADIEKSLKKIEQAQYMVYAQLTEMNNSLNQMSSTMDAACCAIMDIQTNTKDMGEHMAQISKNTKVMAHNTAVAAYYSKVNAELTNALGFMVALK